MQLLAKKRWISCFSTTTEVFNVYDLFSWCGKLSNVYDAEVIVSDYNFPDEYVEGKEVIRSYDIDKMLKYIQPS